MLRFHIRSNLFNSILYGADMVIEQQRAQMHLVPVGESTAYFTRNVGRKHQRAQSPRRTILYIGGDHDCRIMLSRVIRRIENVQLLVADSGREGRLSAFARSPNLILLDSVLLDCDPQALMAHFGRSVLRTSAPVAVVSGDDSDRVPFIRAGAVAWIAKPLSVAHVEESMLRLLDIFSLQ